MSKPILIVEDDTDIRENLTELLESEGYPVWKAANGKEALEKLRAEKVKPGLIFLDLMMPILDGRAFLAIAEKDPYLCDLTIIVLSAASGDLKHRVTDFMKKPVDLERILSAALQHCG